MAAFIYNNCWSYDIQGKMSLSMLQLAINLFPLLVLNYVMCHQEYYALQFRFIQFRQFRINLYTYKMTTYSYLPLNLTFIIFRLHLLIQLIKIKYALQFCFSLDIPSVEVSPKETKFTIRHHILTAKITHHYIKPTIDL